MGLGSFNHIDMILDAPGCDELEPGVRTFPQASIFTQTMPLHLEDMPFVLFLRRKVGASCLRQKISHFSQSIEAE